MKAVVSGFACCLETDKWPLERASFAPSRTLHDELELIELHQIRADREEDEAERNRMKREHRQMMTELRGLLAPSNEEEGEADGPGKQMKQKHQWMITQLEGLLMREKDRHPDLAETEETAGAAETAEAAEAAQTAEAAEAAGNPPSES